MACKTYRDLARAERGVKRPNMVVPCTAHVAFDKVCSFCIFCKIFTSVKSMGCTYTISEPNFIT